MAFRRNLAALADTLLKQHLQQKNLSYEDDLIRNRQKELSKQNFDQQIFGKLLANPEDALAMKQAGMTEIGGQSIDPFVATGESRLAGFNKQTNEAADRAHLPTAMSAFTKPPITTTDAGDSGNPTNPKLADLASGKARLGDQTGGMSSLQDLSSLTNSLTNRNAKETQIGINEKHANDLSAAKAQGDAFSGAMGTEQAAAANNPAQILRKIAEEDQTRKSKVTTAGQTAFAQGRGQAAGAAPYSKPDFLYDQNTGTSRGFRYGPGGATEVQMPPGLSEQAPQRLSAAQVDTLSSLNTAETEGVKVLQSMKEAGLDQSNNMLDPRWNTFAVGKLKIAPGDWMRADEVQRTQFVKAAILRSLMGARPSQYIAEIYNEHVPDSKQTGAQLYHVMSNVLEQVGSRRQEMEGLVGRQPGSLAPISGQSFDQWRNLPGNNGDPANPSVPQELSPGLARRLSGGQ